MILAVMLFVTTSARAEDGIQDIPPGKDQIVAMDEGQRAPFSGQLFSTDTALRWGNWLMQYKRRLTLDVEREQKLCGAQLKYHKKLLSIEEDRSLKLSEDLRERLVRSEQRNAALQDDINHPSFWSSIEFGLILGVVGSAAVAVAVGVAAN